MRVRIHEEVGAFAEIRAQLHNGCLQLQRKLLDDEEWSMEAPAPRVLWQVVNCFTICVSTSTRAWVSATYIRIVKHDCQHALIVVCLCICMLTLTYASVFVFVWRLALTPCICV